MKGASDDAPVTYEVPATKKTTHGSADGRKACLHHCVTYTATQAAVAGLGARALGIRVHPGAAAAALALSFGTHYIADRRVPGHGVLEKLADKTGKTNFYKLASHGMNGAFHLDNSWHHGWDRRRADRHGQGHHPVTGPRRTRIERVHAAVRIASLVLQQIEDDLRADDVDQEELAAILRELIEDTDPPGAFWRPSRSCSLPLRVVPSRSSPAATGTPRARCTKPLP
ncbi:hypothetical protein [Streptomyces griseoluteus]|uniref:hypothetical protein n=1 Tax=Streptomyces griseoluteus TaxID=29306 RepID=UPI0036FE2B51